MRLVCLAGTFDDDPDGASVLRLGGAGYIEPTAAIRSADPAPGTRTDGRWTDYVFLKPALRAQAARLVFTGADEPPIGDHYGIYVEFEV